MRSFLEGWITVREMNVWMLSLKHGTPKHEIAGELVDGLVEYNEQLQGVAIAYYAKHDPAGTLRFLLESLKGQDWDYEFGDLLIALSYQMQNYTGDVIFGEDYDYRVAIEEMFGDAIGWWPDGYLTSGKSGAEKLLEIITAACEIREATAELEEQLALLGRS